MAKSKMRRVYHFCGAQYGLQNLQKQRLKVATIMDLNDPFELIAQDMKDPKMRRSMRAFKAGCSEKYGFICFSRSSQSPVQWGHYGEKHKGICIGFDVPSELLHSIKYTDERLRFDSSVLKNKQSKLSWMADFLVTKHSHWSYEQEERMIVDLGALDRDGDYLFSSFKALEIEVAEVLVGCNSKVSRKEVAEALGDKVEKVDAFKVRPGFGEFKVVRNKDETLWI